MTVVAALLIEVASGLFVHTQFIYDPTDIQTVSVLNVKLNRFLAAPAPRAIFIGDSVINGVSLGEHGDHLWREHTIDTVFQKLSPQWSTVNLGFNGALPCDLYYLYRNYLKNIPLELLVFDIGIRSFATDFEAESASLSRPWLQKFTWHDKLLAANIANDPRQSIENRMGIWLINHSYFFALRDFLQWRYMGGPLSQVLPATVKNWRGGGGQEDDLAALLPAKARYARIQIKTESRQVGCLRGLLQGLSATDTPTIVFLSHEKPGSEDILLNKKDIQRLRNDLKFLILQSAGPSIQYIEKIPDLKAELYLDHIHVNATGNALIARELEKGAHRIASIRP